MANFFQQVSRKCSNNDNAWPISLTPIVISRCNTLKRLYSNENDDSLNLDAEEQNDLRLNLNFEQVSRKCSNNDNAWPISLTPIVISRCNTLKRLYSNENDDSLNLDAEEQNDLRLNLNFEQDGFDSSNTLDVMLGFQFFTGDGVVHQNDNNFFCNIDQKFVQQQRDIQQLKWCQNDQHQQSSKWKQQFSEWIGFDVDKVLQDIYNSSRFKKMQQQ
eukprot:TRINITY_DN1815_c0_g1_i2.p1 TRINITY_DN1815_c0_g1~~TRINITY_DN1815_c0_g1_i2.p1  ORF type:complete len:253 (+),score=13.08 TRINITY_DN1815_c0_g1_i2:112-759(+)